MMSDNFVEFNEEGWVATGYITKAQAIRQIEFMQGLLNLNQNLHAEDDDRIGSIYIKGERVQRKDEV